MILSDDPLGTWIFATIFFVIALITRLIIIILVPDLTVGGAVISGAPYSDAHGWYSLACSVYEGHGVSGAWSARRPFYAILMATVFSWTGPSYLIAVLTNIVLSAASVTLVYLICERVFDRLVAIPTALAVAFNPRIFFYSLVTLSETAGFFCSLVALWFLISAAERGRFSHSFFAGISFGIENLTRTLSLLALPGFAFCLSLIHYWSGHNLKRALVIASLFVIGVGIVLSPWIIRQKMVHGILAISDNSAVALYAASSPKWKVWSSGVHKEADEKGIAAGITDRYEYFNKAFISNVKDNPFFYLKNVSVSFQNYLTRICPRPFDENVLIPFALFLSGLLILAMNVASLKNVLIITIPIIVWCCFILFMPYDLTSLAVPALFLLGLIYWPEKSQLFLINSTIFVGLGASLFAMGDESRVVLATKWVPVAFFFAIVIKSSEFAIKKYGQPLNDHSLTYLKHNKIIWGHQETWFRKLKVVSTLGIVVLAVMTLLGVSKLVWSNFIVSVALDLARFEISKTQRQEILAYLKNQLPSVIFADEKFLPLITHVGERGINHGRLAIAEGQIFQCTLYRLKAGANPAPGDRMFAQRNYFRTCFYLAGFQTIFPFDIPEAFCSYDLVAVGRLDVNTSGTSDSVMFEGLAIFPYDRDENKILFDQGLIANNTEHLELLRHLRNESLTGTTSIPHADSKK